MKLLDLPGLRACHDCDLAKAATHVVLGETGDQYDGVFMIGEAPGPEEDRSDSYRPFIGASGQFLEDMLHHSGMSRDNFHLTNGVKHWPHVTFLSGQGKKTKTIPPKANEVKTCVNRWLNLELKKLKPHTIVTLGGPALNIFIKGGKVTLLHRRVFEVEYEGYGPLRVIPLYHPAAAMHNPGLEAEVRGDFAMLPQLLEKEPEREEAKAVDYLYVHSARDVRVATDILAGDFPAIDTEYEEGVHVSHTNLLGLSASCSEGVAFYIDAWHPDFRKVLVGTRALLLDESTEKALWNAAADLTSLKVTDAKNYHDGMLMAGLLEEPFMALKENAGRTLRINTPTLTQLKAKYKVKTVQELPEEVRAWYACGDPDFTRRLTLIYARRLRQHGLWDIYENFELPLVPSVMEMQTVGMGCDPNILDSIEDEITPQSAQAVKDIMASIAPAHLHRLAELSAAVAKEGVFNPRSHDQMHTLLFTIMKLPVNKVSRDTGLPSADKDVVAELALSHPQIKLWRPLLRFRELDKIQTGYVNVLRKAICSICGRLHTSIRQLGTETGRFSMADPNLQTLPIQRALGRRIKEAMTA